MLKQLKEPFQYVRPKVKLDNESNERIDRWGRKHSKARDWKGTLKRIWLYLASKRLKLSLVLLMIIISAGLGVLGPFLIGRAIDHYIDSKADIGLIHLIIALVFVYVFNSFAVFLQNIWMISISQDTVFKMRSQLLNKFHRLPISFFDQRQHGELMSRVTNDIENVSSTLNNSGVTLFSSILTLIGTICVMVWLSPILMVVTIIVVPIMFFGIRWITSYTKEFYKAQQRNLGDMNGYIEETISGQPIVKTFSQEEKVIEEFREKNKRLNESGFWAQTYSGFIPKLMNFLNNLSYALIAGIGGLLALHHMITIGTIVVFAEYARQFTRPLNDLANQFNTLLSAVAGAERVFEILDEDEEEADETEAIELENVIGEVDYNHASFSYEDGGDTVRDINFHVDPGQTVALVGPTGAGKTTLINLLSRFYGVNSGEILIDGHNISQIKRSSLRQHMGFVLQDTFLFEGTIRENIRYGRLNATDEEVVEAAKLANAHSFIMKMPEQYDTILTQDGGGISQGQKQLLSIARAILADPKILILDEATSSIDTVTELKIQEALQRLMEGRTSIVIAHRLNTIQKADVILVLNDGQIIEKGSHNELLEEKGFYYDLYHSQLENLSVM